MRRVGADSQRRIRSNATDDDTMKGNAVTRSELFRELELVLEVDAGSITGDEVLSDLGWNSLAVLTFIAMADEKFGVNLSASAVEGSKSISDLIALLGDKVANP